MSMNQLESRPRRQKTTPALHTNFVSLAVPDRLFAGIEHAAWRHRVSRSEIIRRALEEFLKGELV